MPAPQQRSRGPKGSFRPHARYVPKIDIVSSVPATEAVAVLSNTSDQSASSQRKPATPLTTSLRSSVTAKPATADKSDGSSFPRYLPQDEAVASGFGADAGGLDSVESQAVVDFLNDELRCLLMKKPRDFWKEVAKNDSLHQFLDSYLQFRSRWYDFPHRGSRGVVAGVIVGEADLCRRVFLVLYRMSSNRDPGAHASDYLSIKDHTALLQEKRLFELPKLLDICAIYGHENGDLTKSLVENAIKVQPQILDNLGGVVSHFLSIVHTMSERCNKSVELLASCGGDGGQGFMQLSNDFLEVMDFINDAIMTFEAFTDTYRPAAFHFSVSFETGHGNDELLNTIARLHDSLIPSMLHGFSLASNDRENNRQESYGEIPNIYLSFKMLSKRIVEFGWMLLDSCYLNGELTDENLLRSTSKVFPASVDNPSLRGDILVQTLKEINGESHYQVEHHNFGTFNENIEKKYKIFSKINNLCSQGWISLDEEQLQYLSRILNSSSSTFSASAPALPIPSHISQPQADEEAVLLDSKISQIKDLFPDYGGVFLKACLEVYNHDTEEVIRRILEGTLHEDLLSLDTSAEQIPQSNQTNLNDKGKAVLLEQPSSQKKNPISAPLDFKRQNAGGSSSSPSSFGRFTRKSTNDALDSEVLDSRSSKDAIRSAILAAEFEYEDEYDDSFDDLGLSAVESGFEETENLSDGINLSSGKSIETDQSSGTRWNSQKKPLFYVKDGKNYSYKVSGSVGVTSVRDAAIWNEAQKELIHGLGRGGNLPLGAVKVLEDSDRVEEEESIAAESSGRGSSGFRGRGGRRGGGRGNHYRKDRAMKKHFSGLSGY
ncbi:activating signal cointegrator 1 complex subunit 2 [Phalaenopsis equestris]|uniref:activating signal cointegrator 1 complex subunit 2 n=1 Tax=Phalaenopsis equestris TaxID=78828 RepID=UPI0009E4D6D3|nr:activating signal cointegrator 1 complex subunit 2 [Phalaenopsis equestris]